MVSDATLLAIVEAACPAGRRLAAPDASIVEPIHRALDQLLPGARGAYDALVRTLDLAAVPLTGRRLSKLPVSRRIEVLSRLADNDKLYWVVRAVTAPMKIARARALEPSTPSLALSREPQRHDQRIVDARTFSADEEIEVDAVVVGTGAGGAPVAKALASSGYAVLMLEEGGHFTRADFTSDPFEMQQKMYRRNGATIAWGNALIPIPLGKTVGGTTTINSGTCFRVPDSVLHRWQLEGLHELTRGELDPYFDRVETMLEVAPTEAQVLGGAARVIQRACETLGWAHAPLRRNAPGCDGRGVCCFGCPSDAKRSTNVSYVPAAVKAGAMVFCHARASKVLIENGRAVGVLAHARRANGTRARIVVRARAVVLACGAIHTPAFLLAQGIANASGRVGAGLTIHPTGHAFATFREEIRGWPAVPQGYSVDEFVDQGIRFEGGTLPPVMAAGASGALGTRWTHLVERMDEIATFGFMISDSSRGSVRLGPDRRPIMRYSVNDADRLKMIRAHGLLARMFLAGGAEAVYPAMRMFTELRSIADVERLEREGPARLRAHHLDIAAFHPLGTCSMGIDPSKSVVGPTHETHDVPGLFISDGSVVNGPLGVNPQVTIMALAERASEFVARAVEDADAIAKPVAVETELEFAETMAGTYSQDGGPERRLEFTVRARTAPSGVLSGELELHGELTMEGVATRVPCEGRLLIRPLRSNATLTYDLAFVADDGTPLTLHGEKNVSVSHPLAGMTTLHTEVSSGTERIGQGVLRFDVRDLPAWLWSFRFADIEVAA